MEDVAGGNVSRLLDRGERGRHHFRLGIAARRVVILALHLEPGLRGGSGDDFLRIAEDRRGVAVRDRHLGQGRGFLLLPGQARSLAAVEGGNGGAQLERADHDGPNRQACPKAHVIDAAEILGVRHPEVEDFAAAHPLLEQRNAAVFLRQLDRQQGQDLRLDLLSFEMDRGEPVVAGEGAHQIRFGEVSQVDQCLAETIAPTSLFSEGRRQLELVDEPRLQQHFPKLRLLGQARLHPAPPTVIGAPVTRA